jgi:hypothetical protein
MILAVLAILISQAADPALDGARELREKGDDEGVIRVLGEAYTKNPKPRYLFEMSQAHQALGQWVQAEAHLQSALAARDDAWIARYAPMLEEALAKVRARLGTLEIRTQPADGLEVAVNGVTVGRTPLAPLRVVVGTAVVEVRGAGFVEIRRPVEIRAQLVSREQFSMVAAAPPLQPVVAVEPAPAPPPRADVVAAPAPAPTVSAGPPALTWVLGAVALVGVGAGTTAGVLSNGDASTSNELGCPSRPADDAQCVGLQDDIATKRNLGIVAFSVAGAAVVGAVVAWLVE